MTEQSYNLKYTGKEIDDLLDKANDLDDSAQVPAGGTSGQVLTKKSGTDFDTQWETPEAPSNPLPTGGTTGQVLAKKSDTNYDAEWIDAHSGDSNVVIAIIDENGALNKTYNELLAAVNANKVVFIKDLTSNYSSYFSYQYIHSVHGLLFTITGTRIYDDTQKKVETPYIGVKSDNTFVHGKSFNGGLVPEGGTTGQVLAKSSNNNYEVTWVSQTGGSGGGGSGDSNVVVAVYQKDSSGNASLSMTYDEILSAIGANKVVIIKDNVGIFSYSTTFIYQFTDSNGRLMFEATVDSRVSHIRTPLFIIKNDGSIVTGSYYSNGSLPTGGATGQFLRKKSNVAFAAEWVDAESIASSASLGYLWKDATAFSDGFTTFSAKTINLSKLNVAQDAVEISIPVIVYFESLSDFNDNHDLKTAPIPSYSLGFRFTSKLKASDGGYREFSYSPANKTIEFKNGINSQGTTDNSVCVPVAVSVAFFG